MAHEVKLSKRAYRELDSITKKRIISRLEELGQDLFPRGTAKLQGRDDLYRVRGRGDAVIMKRLELPDLRKEWDEIFKAMDAKRLKISENEILDEIAAVRREEGRTRSASQ